MVEFKLKPITWPERKALMKALQEAGKTVNQIAEDMELPVDFVETAFNLCVEGFDDIAALNDLSFADLQRGAVEVFSKVFLKAETEKKS